MNFRDIFSLAFRSVTASRLRTSLTVAIIALGITAIVGIFTAIDSLKNGIFDSFSAMGANGFMIRNREMNVRIGGGGGSGATKGTASKKRVKTSNKNKVITFQEAMDFKKRFDFPSMVSIWYRPGSVTVYSGSKKTNPNIAVIGGDENYLKYTNYDLQAGRDFNEADMESARNVAIIGPDIAKKLFGEEMRNVVGSPIRLGNVRYRVIGVLTSKGSSNLFSPDNIVITTVTNVRRVFNRPNASYNINVSINDPKMMDAGIGEATGLLRIIRHIGMDEESNFYITKNDSIAEMLFNSLAFVTIAAIVIGAITLIGSAIGLMNIMLVSVAERTREIGVSKALGATSKTIRTQFLYEAIIISVLGGFVGVFFGMLVGNVVSLILKTSFVVPWLWIGIGVGLCAIVGLLSGILPAIKASKLDPIQALRFE
ncbi:putative ABC transport system permease protein [Chitinophaga skermanii]|uniref:Putative ABC transport system permease protein n=1 Tax=Chitinophaga skermanii TaxID=331697 RepID=A0A327Q2B7_9BACT|nr:ABC transporter permease [Chitinophaga skermanii]RAI98489.1 putative ABC transport system permease protein [Chitinophaga skermanii]